MFFDFSLPSHYSLFCLKTVGACWDDPKRDFFESYNQLFSKTIFEKLFLKTFPAFNIFQVKFLLKKKKKGFDFENIWKKNLKIFN